MPLALALHTTSPELGLALSDFTHQPRCQTWDLGRALSTDLHDCLNEFIQPYAWQDLAFIAVAQGPGSFTGTRIGVVAARTLAQQLEIPLFTISTLKAFAWFKQSQELVASSETTLSPKAIADLKATLSSKAIADLKTTLSPKAIADSKATLSPKAIADLKATLSSKAIDLAVEMPAQRGEVFAAIYSMQAQQQQSPEIMISDMTTIPDMTTLLGDRTLTPTAWHKTLQTWDRPYRLLTTESALGSSATSLLELAYAEWQQGDRPHWASALPFYGQSVVT